MTLQAAVKAALAVALRPTKDDLALYNCVRVAPGEVRATDGQLFAVCRFQMTGPDFEPFLLSHEYCKELARIKDDVEIIIFDEKRSLATVGFTNGREATYPAEYDLDEFRKADQLFDANDGQGLEGEVLFSPDILSRLTKSSLSRGAHETHLPVRFSFTHPLKPAVVRFSDHFKALVTPMRSTDDD